MANDVELREVDSMSNPKILYLDIETTGLAKAYDQVLQVAYAWEVDGELVDERNILVKPSVPISRGAAETHGITEEMVADCPSFALASEDLAARIREADIIATYNGNHYDIPILDAEFKRAGIPIDFNSKLQLDAMRILQVMRPRTLTDMHLEYVGTPLEDAHDALADIRGTQALYRAMKSTFNLDSFSEEQIAHSLKGSNVTIDGKLTWDEWNPGVIIFNYGKYSGKSIDWIVENDPGYLRWIVDADIQRFDSITVELVEIARQALAGTASFYQWVRTTYGPRPLRLPDMLSDEK